MLVTRPASLPLLMHFVWVCTISLSLSHTHTHTHTNTNTHTNSILSSELLFPSCFIFFSPPASIWFLFCFDQKQKWQKIEKLFRKLSQKLFGLGQNLSKNHSDVATRVRILPPSISREQAIMLFQFTRAGWRTRDLLFFSPISWSLPQTISKWRLNSPSYACGRNWLLYPSSNYRNWNCQWSLDGCTVWETWTGGLPNIFN